MPFSSGSSEKVAASGFKLEEGKLLPSALLPRASSREVGIRAPFFL